MPKPRLDCALDRLVAAELDDVRRFATGLGQTAHARSRGCGATLAQHELAPCTASRGDGSITQQGVAGGNEGDDLVRKDRFGDQLIDLRRAADEGEIQLAC